MDKTQFKAYLDRVATDIQKKYAEIYKDTNSGFLDFTIDKDGYISIWALDENGCRIDDLNILHLPDDVG